MARFETTSRFTTEVKPQDVQVRFLMELGARGAHMQTVAENYLEAQTGSQVGSRMKGGAFTKPSEWPMRTTIVITTGDSATLVQVTCVDTLGLGVKVGLRGKYREASSEMIEKLRASVEGTYLH
jgi:hypothetical protein